MSASLTPIYGEAAPKSRARDLPLMGEGTCHRTKCDLFLNPAVARTKIGVSLRLSEGTLCSANVISGSKDALTPDKFPTNLSKPGSVCRQ
ncbi:hypothetical protein DVH24_015226 [Malus domestica]|uniref:Uncharacterized protein n=1 Tax=Malus domestica TaxID=3750 RepID=A0A498K389_MALDO|nr:hypothetical protein DVH24_015226 [Malus domestica]